MGQIMGFEGRVEYVKEATYGSLPYTSTLGWIGDVRSFSVELAVERKNRYRLRPRGATNARTPAGVSSGKEKYSVKIEWAPQASGDVYTYMSFVGLMIGTTTGIGDARESCVINAVHKDGTVEGPLLGCVCNSFSAKCSVGEDVIFEAELLANDYTPTTALNVTSDLTGVTDGFEQAGEATGEVLDYTDVTITLSGTAQSFVTDFEFKIENNAEERYRIFTGAKPDEVVQKPAKITGKLTYDLVNNTELLRAKNGDTFELAITIGEKTWTFGGCYWDKSGIDQGAEDAVQEEMPFTATTITIA